MTKLRHYLFTLLLPTLAFVCTLATVRAQEYTLAPGGPVVVGRKQAEQMSVTRPAPEYPPVAKVNFIQGSVELEIMVNGAGSVASAHVRYGNAILAASALQAAHRWIYHPLSTPAGPAGFVTMVRLKFTLLSGAPELSPRRAEQDFLRQVKPPQMVLRTEDAPSDEIVHMRLLVNDQGQAVDKERLSGSGARFDAAWETARAWTFRPAHWGNLPIASYLDVDVPVGVPPIITRAFVNIGNH